MISSIRRRSEHMVASKVQNTGNRIFISRIL